VSFRLEEIIQIRRKRGVQLRVAVMPNVRERFWFGLVAAGIGISGPISSAHSQQQLPGFFGVFGGIINSAIVDAARREWRRVKAVEVGRASKDIHLLPHILATGVAAPEDRDYGSDRSSSASVVPYWDGASQGTVSYTSESYTASIASFFLGNISGGGGTSSQTICEAHIGASLGSTLELALYNRLRTYMTVVGVP